ncbi:hypothetical protein GO495_06770 [Chitinophaga oryziterrae]|uniref:MMPL family transporter n=1 Tax=Chitinophaga oryziterrae TaxID=1031224 RepID=A0A6N8J6P2_9BACT|nr:efflux RND transporter permease subunit [Chitinophaga oryziterrae]MVT40278.1 hypothetical protein [Chitinophaga oryziterrae]
MTFLTPVRLILLFAVATFLGIVLLPFVKIDLLPTNTSNTLSVKFQTNKSTPKLNEAQYTSAFENVFSQLAQIRDIQSTTDQNGGEILVQFDRSSNLENKRFEISMLVRRLYPHLAAGIQYPSIETASALNKREGQAIRVYMLKAPNQGADLSTIAQQKVVKEFYKLTDLKEVELNGTASLEIAIDYDEQKCKLYHISPQELSNSLQNTFKNTYPGSIKSPNGHQLFIKVGSENTSIAELQNLIITSPQNPNLHLKDLASLQIAPQENTSYLRIDGQNGINVSLYPKANINSLQLSTQLDQMAEKINQKLPAGYSLQLIYDKTEYLQKELHKNYQRTALSIGILLLFILIAYRSLSASIILTSSLFVNLSLTLLLVIICRVNINLYAIGGVTIAFGLMVDNAIVMLDHYRKRRNRNIIPALTGATLNIVMALSLVYLLPASEKAIYQDFAAIIILSLLSSILVALGFTPAIASLFKSPGNNNSFEQKKTQWRNYKRYLNCIQTLSKYKYLLITFFILLFGGGLKLFLKNLNEHAGIRNPGQVKLYITCNMGDGHTTAQMNALFIQIDQYLKQQKGIEKFITYIESGNYGGIEIFLKKQYSHNGYPSQLKAQLMELGDNMQGVKWSVFGLGPDYNSNNTETRASYSILLTGYNIDQLQEQATHLQQKLEQNQRVNNINLNEHYDYRDRSYTVHTYTQNAEQLRNWGIDPSKLQYLLHHLSAQSYPVAQSTINGYTYPIYIRNTDWQNRNEQDFLQAAQQSDSGQQIQLRQFGQLESHTGSNTLYKKNRQYLQVISYDYSGEPEFAAAQQQSLIEEMNKTMPVGYTASKHAYNFDEQSEEGHPLLLPLLLFITFLIGSILFENLKQPFLILTLVPISFIGLFFTFGLGGFTIDQGGYASFMMLAALTANASIFLINDYNQILKHKKQSINASLAKAFYARSRPIVLTVLSCCCSLLPFLFEGKDEVFWYAFAIGTMGGLLFSFISLFIFLPSMMSKKIITLSLASLVFLQSCDQAKREAEKKYLGQDNAIWTESLFFRGHNPNTGDPLTDDSIVHYAKILKEQHIKYAFFFSGPFSKDGHLPSYAFSDTALHSVQLFTKYYPELIILPWVGGIQNKTVFLADSAWVNHATSDCKKLVNYLGVKGVHIDFEHLLPQYASVDTSVIQKGPEELAQYPGYVNAFHKRLRDSLPHAFISAVVTSTPPQSQHWKRKTSVEELWPLLRNIDQLVFLFYDTSISDTDTFRLAAEQQIKDIQRLKNSWNIPMLLAVGTFVNPEPIQVFRHLNVENLPNSLETIKAAALKISPEQKILDGIGIYGNWTTDSTKWQFISKHYTNL